MTPQALLPDPQTMYRAFVEKDASFEGLFVMGVRTTGIFCRPTCPARKPKPENVEFFPRPGDALAAGYRPCKRCRPLEAKGSAPAWLAPLMKAVEADPTKRWTAQDIRDLGIDPARARRWFRAEHGMTFLAYLRSRRLGDAFSRIKEGSDLLEAAASADFDSVSGFCDALRKRAGASATRIKDRLPLKVEQVASPLGPIMVAGDDEAVYLVEFWDRRMLETQFSVLEKRLHAVFFPGSSSATRQIAKELQAYFTGALRRFETPIRFPGTEHQQLVWKELLATPYGETWSYGELAARIGKRSAVRSVARAVGENRFAIVIPCHRIVGADGKLTGYGGGLWRKRFLLEHERNILGKTLL
ncbi:methylated-DNA--[protein]-cysteine S-methyltransferase [Pelagicoccus sp. SDUM812003]|uniref:bifunctional transcriptional activator/DNA repair enzyme AdaA n=1 Tax=Pelagicoccus sp. SDUM812003 TaxID=3041267 RepID=UPI00280CBC6E|nr:methylated-DNA--[protein]-cysteine S-methyltransferase [Pelagicoccus sp. SDUM812003]MDQ8204168.1 methylated-DNA--[protein]-cysteine S-methyltransferase [Pelagicoccus sp. SDUM812003]